MTAECEVQVDWSLLSHGDQKYHDLFATLEDRKSVVAWNDQEQIAPSQVGGMAMMSTDIVFNFTKGLTRKMTTREETQWVSGVGAPS